MLLEIHNKLTRSRDIALLLWQDAETDALARGNKRFKLEDNLLAARTGGYTRVLSFGGAWSNHIHALGQGSAATRPGQYRHYPR